MEKRMFKGNHNRCTELYVLVTTKNRTGTTKIRGFAIPPDVRSSVTVQTIR